jgi:hypothetical protein
MLPLSAAAAAAAAAVTIPTPDWLAAAAQLRREGKREQMRRHRGAAKVEEVQHRAAQYQAAEDAKMTQFRALLASGPITIPKRQ